MRITMMCLRNLSRRRFRTSLCVLGIAFATMFITAIGATTQRYLFIIKDMNVFFRGDILLIAKGAIVIQAVPIGGGNIQEDAVDEIKNINGVKTAVPMLFIITSKIEGAIQPLPTNVSIGVPPRKWSVLVGSTPLANGGNWPSEDSDKKEVVIGSSLAQTYGHTVGSEIKIKSHNLKVVGILDARSVLLSNSIIMPLKLAQDVYGYNMLINMVVVEPREGMAEKELASRIEGEVGGIDALTSIERDEIVEPLFYWIETWNLGIRGILFLLSMILVTTVAIMNVSERRREFATLDAIGAPKSSILRVVVIETSLMGLFGGLAGILLGAFAALLIASFYTSIPITSFFPGLFDLVSPTLMIEILASTVAVSCIAGAIPAIAATRISVAEVLRSEY